MCIDLHCHTKVSDGSVGVEELLYIARRMGIKSLSITDHDTLAGSKRGIVLGPRYGVDVIVGVEFSSFISNLNLEVHILCYMCDFPDRLEGLCLRNLNERKKASFDLINEIEKYYPISHETVNYKARGSACIFKSHIVNAVMDTGFIAPVYSLSYEKLFGKKSKISHICPHYADPNEVISQIHQAGGISILAHPTEDIISTALPILMSLGIDGVEAYHPNVNDLLRNRIIDLSKKYDFLTTGGSDFHGMNSSRQRYLGMCSTSNDIFEKMNERKLKLFKMA